MLICDLSSGSRVAAEWFAAEGGTFTGVDGVWLIFADLLGVCVRFRSKDAPGEAFVLVAASDS